MKTYCQKTKNIKKYSICFMKETKKIIADIKKELF